MTDTMKKILILAGVFVLLNAVLAIKYFSTKRHTPQQAPQQAQQQHAALADDSVIGGGRPVLLELGSDSCVPCKKMMPILEALSTEQTGFIVSFVDVWKVEGKGEQYAIKLIPTQIFFDGQGRELFRHTGFYAKEDILAKWKELGVR